MNGKYVQKSELLRWSPAFSVGIKLIDDQHKVLLNLVNDMFNHVAGDMETEHQYYLKVIRETLHYIKYHFGTEEELMTHVKFPGFNKHKKAHLAFILTVMETIRDFEAGKRFTFVEFTRFLREWILTHIAIMDKQHFTCIKKMAAK